MKGNKKSRLAQDDRGFAFIIPMTLAIVIGMAILIAGAFVIGTMSSALEHTYPDNSPSGTVDFTYRHNATINYINASRNITLPCTAGALTGATTRWYLLANGSAMNYNLTVNSNKVNSSSNLTSNEGFNWTLTALISTGAVANSDTYLNFTWNMTSTGNRVLIVAYGTYKNSGDYRTSNENNTILLIGNVTTGFANIVDIEIVVIIITALSMAILAVMAIASRKAY